jgi:preprotein translocase subunit SecD
MIREHRDDTLGRMSFPGPEPSFPTAGFPAPPPPARRGPWLWLAIGGVVFVVVVAIAVMVGFLVRGSTGPAKGDVSVTFTVFTGTGEPPAPDVLRQVKQILLSRMKAAGLARPTATASGSGSAVTVTAGGTTPERLRQIGAVGRLAFRRVLYSMPENPPGSPAPAGGCRADHPDTTVTDKASALASARTKLGPAYEVAEAIDGPDYPLDSATAARLAPFATLTCAEVAALPVPIQFVVPTITCAMLNARAPDALGVATDQAAACDRQERGSNRYFLDVAKVQGTDLSGADASYAAASGGWQVQLHFTGTGQERWTALTREVTANGDQAPRTQVAIVLDSVVLSAPEIRGVITGDAIISGGIDAVGAKTLAAQLRYGALPVRLIVQSVSTVR